MKKAQGMFKWLNKLSLIQLFFVIIYLPVVIVLFVVILINFNHTKNQFDNHNSSMHGYIADEIENIINFQDIAFEIINNKLNNHLEKKSQQVVDEYVQGNFNPLTDNPFELQKKIGMKNGIEDIYFINTNGIVINTTFPKDLNLNFFNWGIKHKNFLLEIFNSRTFHNDAITIEASTKRLKKYTYQATPDGRYIVELGSYCPEAEEVLNLIEKRMDEIEEKYDNIYAIGLFLKADKAFSFSTKRKPENFNSNLLELAFKNKSDMSLTLDSLDTELQFNFDYIKRGNTSLYDEAVISVISDLAYQKIYIRQEVIRYFIIFLVMSLILIAILRLSFRRNITLPLKKSIKLLDKLSNGEIPELRNNLYKSNKNEIGKLIFSLRKLIINLKRSVEFAQKIEKGDLSASIQISNKNDELGLSLDKMKKGLIAKQKEEKEKQSVEESRKWQMEGLAKFSNIISQHQGDITSLCNSIISELIQYTEIQIGGIYLSKTNDDLEDVLELISSYAYDRQKHIKKEIFFGEGLIGTCAIEQELCILKEIPDNYMSISSGIGGAKPKHLAIAPIVMDSKTLGVIEIASFSTLSDKQISFVMQLAENFGGAILKTQLNAEAEKLREKYETQKIEIEQLKQEKQVLNEWIQNVKMKEKELKQLN